MVRIGIVGLGFMGMIHYLAARGVRGGRVSAVCSRDPKKRAGDWTGIRGNFGPPGQVMDLADVKPYDRLDALLADPDIDLVDVCNPTDQHPDTAIAALRAGKHVLVEKAIALTVRDADRMLDAAAAAGKLLMVAHVLPFFPEFAFAADAVRSGRFGALIGGHFTRVTSRPDWSAAIADAGATGGPAVDLHIHDTHFIGLLCGVPDRVFSAGRQENGRVDYLTTQYLYNNGGPAVSCSSGAVAQPGRPFVHGFQLYLERATLLFESGTTPLTVLGADGRVNVGAAAWALSSGINHGPGGESPPEPAGELGGFTAELQAAVDGVRAGVEPELLGGQLARDALDMCFKECESVRTGQPVQSR